MEVDRREPLQPHAAPPTPPLCKRCNSNQLSMGIENTGYNREKLSRPVQIKH